MDGKLKSLWWRVGATMAAGAFPALASVGTASASTAPTSALASRKFRIRLAGRAFACAAVLAAASSVAGAAPASASASINDGGYYYIENLDGGSRACLDANANTLPANGTIVQTWGCNGWGNQTWIVHLHHSIDWSWYTITNYDGGQCLDANAITLPANGTTVQMWVCNGGGNQDWQFHPKGTTASGYEYGTITNGTGTSECLDANDNTLPANGTKLQIWSCNGWGNQDWVFIPIS